MKRNVFIVHDDPLVGNLIESWLFEAGDKTEYFDTGTQVLENISRISPDLIISAVSLSDMTGFELHRQLENQPGLPSIPFMFLASPNDDMTPLQCLQRENSDYLEKPFTREELFSRIDYLLNPHDSPEPKNFPETIPIIEGTDLFAAIRQLHSQKASGVLEFQNNQEQRIYFHNGMIIHAKFGNTEGKKALFRLFALNDRLLSFKGLSETIHQTIHQTPDQLIEDGKKELHSLSQLKQETFKTTVQVVEGPLDESGKNTRSEALGNTIALAKQYGTVQEIIDASPVSDLQTYRHILYLIKLGVLKVETPKQTLGIHIITDSAADLPQDIVKQSGITVFPMSVVMDDQSYRDGPDMDTDQFYRLMSTSKSLPTTEPPSEQDLFQAFCSISKNNHILGLFISKKLSKTWEHAIAARNRFMATQKNSEAQIEIIDSKMVSLGLGLLVMEAAEKVSNGWTMDDISKHIGALIPRMRLFFMVDNLKYLQRSKQIGKTRSLIGNLLRIRPILGIHNGEIVLIDRTMGGKSAPHQVLDLIREMLINPSIPVKAGVMHANAPEQAERLSELLDSYLTCERIVVSNIGPSVGSHCGPGTIAVACLPVTVDNAPVWK